MNPEITSLRARIVRIEAENTRLQCEVTRLTQELAAALVGGTPVVTAEPVAPAGTRDDELEPRRKR